METIKTYLDNLFSAYPKTAETLKAKEDLFNNMEDKYNELKSEGKSENEAVGIVISEFGNIDELAKDWDFINGNNLKMESDDTIEISFDSARKIIAAKKTHGLVVAVGVMLCILGPAFVVLIGNLITGKGEDIYINLAEPSSISGITDVLTIMPLFICIAVGVILFIVSGSRMSKYEFLEKNKIHLSKETREYVSSCKEAFQTTFSIAVAIGVALCILAPFFVIVMTTIGGESEQAEGIGIFILLTLIAAGVFLFIRFGEEMDAYNQLLQEAEYTPQKKESNKLIGTVASIYWPGAVLIYLIWSFSTMNWEKTWIIWPIAGISFGIIAIICNLINAVRKNGN